MARLVGEVPSVYTIADRAVLGSRPLPAAVEEMAQAGIGWIQLRLKPAPPDRELLAIVEECCRRAEGTPARLWMDDRADLVALLAMTGLHLGQQDLPPAAARRVVGETCWIGRSTHDEAQLLAAEADANVDVVAYGPIFPTRSKERPDPVVGLAGLRRARALTQKPLVAIGGIDESRLPEVLAAGADSAAVLGAACHGNIGQSCARLLAAARQGA